MDKMEILVLHTGGTIASKENGGVISPNSSSPIVEQFKKRDNDYNFTEEIVANILSENADDSFYENLINTLLEKDLSKFQGIIIMHGTDTLSYTASIVSMALRHIDIPVCFVSANHVLGDERSNAMDNFTLAIGYISCGGKGFVVPYRNPDSRSLIHLATRLNQADFATDSFNSAKFIPLAEVVNNTLVSYDNKTGITNEILSRPLERIVDNKVSFNNKVLMIKAYPNIDYSVYDIEKMKPSAILHTTYHSGTAGEKGLCEFIEKCNSLGIKFYLSPIKKNEMMYESTKKLIDCGAIPLYNMTEESALAKIKLSENIKGIDITSNLYYEEF